MSRKIIVSLAACALCLAFISATLVGIQAAPGVPEIGFSIPWWTVDSGGGTSQGGSYRLGGTYGQPDAGRLSGSGFTLVGGFWSGALEQDFTSYLPLITR